MLGLDKSKRLKLSKNIALLFEQGKSVSIHPLRCRYRLQEGSGIVKVGFSVPKKHFNKAVDRNRIKRLMREAYRPHHPLLVLGSKKNNLDLMIIYSTKDKVSYSVLQKALKELLGKLLKRIS